MKKITPVESSLYPVEQSFKEPILLMALFVLIPTLILFFIFGASDISRGLKIFVGNWISPIILWFFTASFFHLWLKSKKLAKEKKYTQQFSQFYRDVDKTERSLEAINEYSQKTSLPEDNLLLSRSTLYLNHRGKSDDIDEAFGIKEREFLRGSYALPRFMIWAIPIVGFIGTVWGISNGISHFSDAMTATSSVTDVSAMLKESLPLVTNSLATAFDTTLLALLLSVPLMMMMLWLEKQEEAYLIHLDETWFHDIKPLFASKQSTTPVVISAEGTQVQAVSTDTSVQSVADEIKLLSTQIGALQETMEDLYETTFADKIEQNNGK
ncbi:MAG: MotA/TolQ/ExbB proton channel family protein [Cocleimonas sp.]|nr:MotA/TolQ/ExbB proton channel family protein [Cocleimonas sp.]